VHLHVFMLKRTSALFEQRLHCSRS